MLKSLIKALALLLAAVAIVVAIALVYIFLTNPSCDSYVGDSRRLSELQRQWQRGELIALVRHTEKCIPREGNCPPGDTGLTEAGKSQARDIRRGFEQLGTANSVILTSPTRRTRQTARIAFGTGIPVQPWLRINCRDELGNKLVTAKPAGKNLVAVTHAQCMNSFLDHLERRELGFSARENIHYGLTAFMRIDPRDGQPEFIGCVWPPDWERLFPQDASPARHPGSGMMQAK